MYVKEAWNEVRAVFFILCMYVCTAILIIIEGHETDFTGLQYQFTTGKSLKNLKLPSIIMRMAVYIACVCTFLPWKESVILCVCIFATHTHTH